jgi:TPP-dependent indolepyruvate ferredoxin oxidoreductase alpha subunit
MTNETKPTMDDLLRFKAVFVNCETGAVVEQPEGVFPIVAGMWPSRMVGAVQVRCTVCSGFASLSPDGVRLHKESPEDRPILCPDCFHVVIESARAMERTGAN